ncbi:MAG TPA: TonB family protein [Terriglobales bacterium]|nr:TonB family protein [Terriglobales bacterium]
MAESWKHWEGRTVDGFPLRRYLGGSDHSCVFLSERTGREPREAAIKLIQASTSDWESQASWWREIARYRHPHLVRLFEHGRCQLDGNELFYCVMESGEENLAEILPHRPLTPEEVREMLRQVLDALAYLHRLGFVHGHIKPANILAIGDQVKLSSDNARPRGETGRILGLPRIPMATEVATGEGFSPALDVLCLGTLLVEALTQRPPLWKGTERPRPVLPKTLPAPFGEIASHVLRRDPQDRWTVAQITAHLDQPPQQASVRAMLAKPGIILPGSAAILLLLAMTAVPRLRNLHREAHGRALESSPAPSSLAESPSTPPGVTNTAMIASSPDSPGGRLVSGGVAEQPVPIVPKSARNTIRGRILVRLRVGVDPAGEVTTARFDFHGPSRYFAKLALEAAEQWKFSPPQINGHVTASEWLLSFEFTRSGTTAHSTPLRP